MTRKRVAVFCRKFLPYSETFIYDELLHHTRWEADVFCRVRIEEARFPFDRVHAPGRGLRSLAYRAMAWWPPFERTLREGGHAVLHAHFGTSAVYALPYALRLRIPLVVTLHGHDAAALLGRPRLGMVRYRALARQIFQRADLMLCASEELQSIVADFSQRPDATRVHRIGIDVRRFARAPEVRDVPTIVMIGRFVEKKGHLDGIEAFGRALARGCDARLVIVGDGPLAAKYRDRVARLDLVDRVRFAGVLDARAVGALLSRTDVLLAPSKVAPDGDRESGLIVAKEAGAASVVVLGTRHGGIPEIVEDGVTGMLVDEGDVAALADRLGELLGNESLRARLGAAACAKMAREYDVRDRVSELESLYDSLL